MRNIPFEVILTWPTPNYVNPPTQGESLIIVNAIFATLVVVAVLLRLYTRVFLKRWVGSDDIFIVIAAVFTLGLNTAVILANAKFYWNRHVWDIPLNEIHHVGKIAMAAKVLFVCAAFFTRGSLLSFYYRLTHDTGLERYKWVMHLAMAFNIGLTVAFIPLSIFQCTPISGYWTFPPAGKCINEGATTLAAGILNCLADAMVTVLPIPMIMKLNIPLNQRLGVVVLLGLGFIVTIAGIIRTYFIWKSLMDSYDETWYAYPLWICAAVEIDLAVLCACAPTLRPLLIKLTKGVIDSFTSRYGKGSQTGGTDKELGMLSTGASAPSRVTTTRDPNVAYELGKVGGEVLIEETSKPMSPRSKWSSGWKLGEEESGEVPMSPPNARLAIMERHSFEIRHETTKEGRPAEDAYARLQDPAEDLRNQWDRVRGYGPTVDKARVSHARNSSSKSSISRPLDPNPRSRTNGTLSTVGESFTLPPEPAALSKKDQTPNASATHLNLDDSFYISQDSQDGNSTPRSKKSEEWPLGPAADISAPGLLNGERRWEIAPNPFKDPQNNMEPPRAAMSGGIPEHARWRSGEDTWTEIHAKRAAEGRGRSGSLRDRGPSGGL